MTTPDRSQHETSLAEDWPVEADPADVEEQHTPAGLEEDQDPVARVHVSPEVPEADAVEQATEVYDDDEEDPR